MKSEKVCSHCKQLLQLSAFGTHKKRSGNGKVYDFRRNTCKACYAAYEKNRRPAYSDYTPEQKEAHGVRAQKRRAKLYNLPRGFTASDWRAALEHFEYCCAYCGEPASKFEQEHFVPVRMGGGYTKNNIVPACPKCNSDKRGKNPIDWIAGLPNALITYAKVIGFLGR